MSGCWYRGVGIWMGGTGRVKMIPRFLTSGEYGIIVSLQIMGEWSVSICVRIGLLFSWIGIKRVVG